MESPEIGPQKCRQQISGKGAKTTEKNGAGTSFRNPYANKGNLNIDFKSFTKINIGH